MTSENANITLRPCPMCGSQPVMQIMRQCFDNVVYVQCSSCGAGSGGVFFAGRRVQRDLLPDLATARRQAAALWNGEGNEQG